MYNTVCHNPKCKCTEMYIVLACNHQAVKHAFVVYLLHDCNESQEENKFEKLKFSRILCPGEF